MYRLIMLLFAIIIALLLLVYIIIVVFNINPASYNRVCSYNTSVTIVDNTIYSAFTIDKAILNCLMLF